MALPDQQFLKELPSVFKDIHSVLTQFSLTPTAVGGIPRDYILNGVIGHDWDIELSSSTLSFSKDHWKDLGKALSALGKVSYLSYEIIRLDTPGYQFEFSPPRKEVYREDWKNLGHSNFDAHFDFKLSFEESARRRDFTVNAIGFRFNDLKKVEVLDPFEGIRHLTEMRLYACSPDFEKDPIRFFRGIRFAFKLKFDFSPTLEATLKEMPLSQISAVHLWSEMNKSQDPLSFYLEVLKWQSFHPELKLPIGQELLVKREEIQRLLKEGHRHETWIMALEWVGLSHEAWAKFFSVSSESSRRLARWAQTSKKFIQLLPEKFHGEFEEIRLLPEFEDLFDWYFSTKQLLQKNPELPLLKMIEDFTPAWVHLYRFEPVKDVKHIDPPLRAKYQVWNLCQRI